MNAYNQVAWEAENARLLEKLCAAGTVVKTFEQWKSEGKWVKRGEKRKAFKVRSGVRPAGIDPITGDDRFEPLFKTAYGFTADQVR